MFKILLAILLITSAQSFAGQDGNGGFGLECNGQLTLLDLYEAKTRYNYNFDLGPSNLSVDQKVELMLKRWERFNGPHAKFYQEKYKKFWERAIILNGQIVVKHDDVIIGDKLSYASDIGSTILPDNCSLVALARNLSNPASLGKDIFLMGKYWNKLDNDNKAALIVHEMIYSAYIKTKHSLGNGSEPVRKLIALLSSTEAETLPLDELILFQSETYNVNKSTRGKPLYISSSHVFDFGINNFTTNLLVHDSLVLSADKKYVESFVLPNIENPEVMGSGTLNYKGKNYKYFLLLGENFFITKDLPQKFLIDKFEFTIDTTKYAIDLAILELYKNKQVRKITSYYPYTGAHREMYKKILKHKNVEFIENPSWHDFSFIEFYPNGKLRCLSYTSTAYNAQDKYLVKLKLNGKSVLAREIQFDLDGKPISNRCTPNKSIYIHRPSLPRT
ncbi:MAG: hypothetical protein V4596_14280 [Bdellovibrionota bacterium]